MLTPPEIVASPFQRAAVIRLIVPRIELAQRFSLALAEILATLADQRLAPVGPAFAHYLRITHSHADFEVGLPIDHAIRPCGRVDPGQLRACTVARSVHQGPWSSLCDAWTDFDRWLAPQPHTPAADVWERYLTDPLSTPDPTQHRTELNRPLRR